MSLAEPTEVVALFGPTAIGKTAIAIALAHDLRERGEDPVAVSVDSMQVYRELPIITGAATAAEQAELEHRLVATRSVTEEYDVVTHSGQAHAAIDQLRAAGRRPIVVGGTGLYLRAALTQLDFLPPPGSGVRERLEAEAAEQGVAALFTRLETLDPDAASAIDDPGNARRVIRALETVESGVTPAARSENKLWTDETRVPTRLFALVMDREALYERVNARALAMVAAGAAEEVRAADALGMSRTARQALGVDELLAGDAEALKTNTRRYAKRQLTWLRKLSGATTIDATNREPTSVAAAIAQAVTG